MKLNEIRDNAGAVRARKRIGRGIGSGTGKTAGKGAKGQNARSRVALKGFEGGQMPLDRRLPKRGFHNMFRREFEIVNLDNLQRAIDAGRIDGSAPITVETLRAAKLVKKQRAGVRLLARGAFKAPVTIEVTRASKAAVAAVEKAGGKVVETAPAPDKKGADESGDESRS